MVRLMYRNCAGLHQNNRNRTPEINQRETVEERIMNTNGEGTRLRRFYVVGIIGIVLAVGMAIFTTVVTIAIHELSDRLKVEQALNATGPCGTEKIVVLDENRVAAAGWIVTPETFNSYRFVETEAGGLKVYNRSGDLLMERPPRPRR